MLRRENEDLQKRNRELEAKVAELTAAVSLKTLVEFINIFKFFCSLQNMKEMQHRYCLLS